MAYIIPPPYALEHLELLEKGYSEKDAMHLILSIMREYNVDPVIITPSTVVESMKRYQRIHGATMSHDFIGEDADEVIEALMRTRIKRQNKETEFDRAVRIKKQQKKKTKKKKR